MQCNQQTLKRRAGWLAGVLALLIVVAGLLAARDSQHHLQHHDSTCLACALTGGQLDSPLVSVILPLATFVLLGLVLVNFINAGHQEFLQPPGRAPPFA